MAKQKKTKKTAWVVEFGMLDRQRANVVVIVEGENGPTPQQLSDAYNAVDDGWEIDTDFSPDEGTHFVLNQIKNKKAISKYPVVDMTGEYPEYIAPTQIAKTETWYCWRELKTVENEAEPRLLVPWADPMKHEFAFDFVYRSHYEARKGLKTMGVEPEDSKDWILCKMTLEPIQERR